MPRELDGRRKRRREGRGRRRKKEKTPAQPTRQDRATAGPVTAHGCTVYMSQSQAGRAVNHTSIFTAEANLAPTVFGVVNIHSRGRPDAEHRYMKAAHPLFLRFFHYFP